MALVSSGTSTTHRSAAGTGTEMAMTRPSLSAHDTVSPPHSAAATLSGWPSARAASASNASRDSGPPSSALPATSPPTQAAALEPRPRAGGMRLTQASATPLNVRAAAS